MVQRCKSCNADVEWVKTEAGKPLILDAKASQQGNVVLLVDDNDRLYAKVVNPGEYPTKPRRMPHWATCPDSDRWRGQETGSTDSTRSPVRTKQERPTRDSIATTLDEIRGLYYGARVKPSAEVTRVMQWLRNEAEL